MIFLISVTVSTDTIENASKIANDRLGNVTKDYGFEYTLGYPVVAEGLPMPFEAYTDEELLTMTKHEFEELVGNDVNEMTRDQLRIALLRLTDPPEN